MKTTLHPQVKFPGFAPVYPSNRRVPLGRISYHSMKPANPQPSGQRRSLLIALVLSALLVPGLHAVMFEIGNAKGSFDTTLSFGLLGRLNNPEKDFYGLAAGGNQRSVNSDDGNLNYHKGLASSLTKATHDLQLDFGTAGVFVRGFYFTDFTNTNGQRQKIGLTKEAKKIVGEGSELLDAYVFFKPTLGDMPARISVGRQVLSWGESTFIPNGINSINPIDVAKLRTPGSELKEALRPLNMISASINLTDDLALEGFYLLDWERTRVDPPGTYFSTNDFVAQGGKKVYLGFGAIADTAQLGAITRGTDNEPGKSGQYGVNLRWLASGLKDTEFGLFYMNYHSRLPGISARTPTGPVDVALVQATASSLASANIAPAMIGAGIPAATVSTVLPQLVGAALTSVPAASLPAGLAPYAAFYPAAQSVASGARTIGFLTAAASGRYLIEFPEDIHLVGASFNTSISGVAIQGELSYRSNQPFQADDVELLFAALSPLNPAYGPNNQLGNYLGQYSTYIAGYRRLKVYTGQMTVTKAARGILGADQSTLLGEVGFVSVPDLPDKSVLRFDGPGTFVGGDLAMMTATGNAAAGSEPADAFADSFSWGYQVLGRLDYNNLFAGVNVSPLAIFSHDVAGNTPQPMGNFRRERKTITIGADFTFQNSWALELRYVNFTGGGKYNLLSDRDFVSATLKYSF